MKIEICEQMVQSWLQHIEKCQVVQTNWMISPLRMPKNHPALSYVKWFMEDIAQRLNDVIDEETKAAFAVSNAREAAEHQESETSEETQMSSTALAKEMMSCFAVLNDTERSAMKNIFGKSTPHQFVTQCEIDVVGVKFHDGEIYTQDQTGVKKIYLIDAAFHKGNLGYGDVVATVLKKLIRACLVSKLVFGTRYAVEIAFATPDCKPGYTNKIEDLVKILRDLLKKHYPSEYDNIEIKLYFNDVFATKIYHPLREEIDKLNNDNDLFMRSLNLAKVAENKLPDSMKAAASVGKKSRSTAKSGGRRSGSSGTAKGVSVRRRYTEDEKYAEAAYYLCKGAKLTEVEEVCLGVNNSGGTAKGHLNKLGIDTSDNSQHKGMLSAPNSIEDAIANAADDTLKRTLKEIKARGLHLKP